MGRTLYLTFINFTSNFYLFPPFAIPLLHIIPVLLLYLTYDIFLLPLFIFLFFYYISLIFSFYHYFIFFSPLLSVFHVGAKYLNAPFGWTGSVDPDHWWCADVGRSAISFCPKAVCSIYSISIWMKFVVRLHFNKIQFVPNI